MVNLLKVTDIHRITPSGDVGKRQFVKTKVVPFLIRVLNSSSPNPISGRSILRDELSSMKDALTELDKEARELGLISSRKGFFLTLQSCLDQSVSRNEGIPTYKDVLWKARNLALKGELLESVLELRSSLQGTGVYVSADFYGRLTYATGGDVIAELEYSCLGHTNTALLLMPFSRDTFYWDAGGYYNTSADEILINADGIQVKPGEDIQKYQESVGKMKETMAGLSAGTSRLSTSLVQLGTQLYYQVLANLGDKHYETFKDHDDNVVEIRMPLATTTLVHESWHRIDAGATGLMARDSSGEFVDLSTVMVDSAMKEATAMLSPMIYGSDPRLAFSKILTALTNSRSSHAKGARIILPYLTEGLVNAGLIESEASVGSKISHIAGLDDVQLRTIASFALKRTYERVEVSLINEMQPGS